MTERKPGTMALPLSCRMCGLADSLKCDHCPTKMSRQQMALGRISARWPELPYCVAVALFIGGIAVGRHF